MQAKTVTPIFLVDEIKSSIEFYEMLEFRYLMGVDKDKQLYMEYKDGLELSFAIVQNGNVQIMLQSTESVNSDLNQLFQTDKSVTNSINYIEIEGFDHFYQKVKEKVEIVNEPRNTFYGMKEFYIKDNNGNIIGFAEKLV
jgi:uncharacterized glyoxalase superfamily protein PhnB